MNGTDVASGQGGRLLHDFHGVDVARLLLAHQADLAKVAAADDLLLLKVVGVDAQLLQPRYDRFICEATIKNKQTLSRWKPFMESSSIGLGRIRSRQLYIENSNSKKSYAMVERLTLVEEARDVRVAAGGRILAALVVQDEQSVDEAILVDLVARLLALEQVAPAQQDVVQVRVAHADRLQLRARHGRPPAAPAADSPSSE